MPPADRAPATNLDTASSAFESAWKAGAAPRLADFLPAAADAARDAILQELIKIDLEYRWRQDRRGLFLEDYVNQHAELGPLQDLPLELIAEEYWARCQWGDRPSAGEYLRRFPRHGPALRSRLAQVDQDVLRESQASATRAAPAPRPPAPSAASSNPLLPTLQQLAILTPIQLTDAAACGGDAHTLARELLRRGWLTALQANLVLQGRTAELLVGPYLLYERIGQGGAGEVYKARHQHMERIVALKLLKKDLVGDPEVLARFLREMKVVSQLVHPHVVHAYDAGPSGSNYFLAMEYVEGIDLARLVKEKGPLPVAQGCDFIRQAALGLQHIHERGLVHRDIKPSNLLVAASPSTDTTAIPSPWGLVKILDLGLAKLRQPVVSDAAGQVTGPGAMMLGTLDYMAPDQAIDFHHADIRADIYSLGCSFYYLLTGRPPFPDCTVAEKLLRHQVGNPKPLEQFRTDLPAHVGPILSRMMAKAPADRFQTPREIAEALTVPPSIYVPAVVGSRAAVPASQAATPVAILVVDGMPVTASPPWQRVRLWMHWQTAARRPGQRRWLLAGLGGAVLLAVVLLWALLRGGAVPPAYVADLPILAVGPGEFSRDGTHRVSIDGKLAASGFFVYPPDNGTAYARFRLGKKYKVLKAAVGLNDGAMDCTPITFTVLLDGKKGWESRPISKKGDRQECEVNIDGADVLELAVTCPGPRSKGWPWAAHAAWIDPLVRR